MAQKSYVRLREMEDEMIPITKPYISDQESQAVKEVLESGWLVQGERVKEFERAVASHEGVKFACATTSCTTALHLAMLAEEMRTGMEVIIPSFTFVATANAVVSTGATPVILDIDNNTYNLSADGVEEYIEEHYQEQAELLVNKTTGNSLWGMVVVHQFGLCADMERFHAIARRYHLKVIEDAACALGSKIGNRHIGGFGNTACVSFHPRKSITTGEGGMILTNDAEIYERVVAMRNHGSQVNSDMRHKGNGTLLPSYPMHGYNFRMTDIQGAIGCEQMKKLDDILGRREEIAAIYGQLLTGQEDLIHTPYVPEGYFHSYQSYVCRLELGKDREEACEKRNRIMDQLQQSGIQTRQGTHAVHKLDYYKKRFGYQAESLKNANQCDGTTIALPVYVTITREEQEYVTDRLIHLARKQADKRR